MVASYQVFGLSSRSSITRPSCACTHSIPFHFPAACTIFCCFPSPPPAAEAKNPPSPSAAGRRHLRRHRPIRGESAPYFLQPLIWYFGPVGESRKSYNGGGAGSSSCFVSFLTCSLDGFLAKYLVFLVFSPLCDIV